MAEPEIYGPAEVCRATHIPRATLHSWLARKLIPVASQGTGRERKFTFEQVVQIAVMAQLMNFAVHAGAAALWSQIVTLPIAEAGDTLIVVPGYSLVVAHIAPGESIDSVLAALNPKVRVFPRNPGPLPRTCILVDVSATAAAMREALAHPDPTWRDDGPAIPEAAVK